MSQKLRDACFKLLSFIAKHALQLRKKLKRAVRTTINYEDLTPIDNVAKSKPYLEALDWALKNKNIWNIAITGPYGSGKTSIIKTFKKAFPGKHYLNISLASFQDEVQLFDANGQPVKKGQMELEDRHRLIELSILQQMFYRVAGKEIPDSRFNRIKKLSNKRMTLYLLVVFATLLGFFSITSSNFPEAWSWYGKLSDPYCDIIDYLSYALLLPSILFLSDQQRNNWLISSVLPKRSLIKPKWRPKM